MWCERAPTTLAEEFSPKEAVRSSNASLCSAQEAGMLLCLLGLQGQAPIAWSAGDAVCKWQQDLRRLRSV